MGSVVAERLERIEFGELQEYENMAVVPLLLDAPPGPEYVTLKEALDGNLLSVVEASEGRSVPELKVVDTPHAESLRQICLELGGRRCVAPSKETRQAVRLSMMALLQAFDKKGLTSVDPQLGFGPPTHWLTARRAEIKGPMPYLRGTFLPITMDFFDRHVKS